MEKRDWDFSTLTLSLSLLAFGQSDAFDVTPSLHNTKYTLKEGKEKKGGRC